MRHALVLAALTIGATVAFFPKPDGAPQAAATVAVLPSATGTASAPTYPAVTASGATELRRADDGHFYAPVTVGAQPITMLVDTGASVVALTGEDARLAGVTWSDSDLQVVAQGASGPVRGVTVRLPRLQLGQTEAREVDAVIVPEGLPVSLLGQSFLSHIEPMRIEKDRMLLGGS